MGVAAWVVILEYLLSKPHPSSVGPYRTRYVNYVCENVSRYYVL